MSKMLPMLHDAYDYVFYRTYAWQLKQWKLRGLAADIAGINVGVLIGFNLMTVISVFCALTKWEWLRFWEVSNLVVAIVGLTWVSIFSHFYMKRIDFIVSKYERENDTDRKRKTYAIWIYNILTYSSCALAAMWAVNSSR